MGEDKDNRNQNRYFSFKGDRTRRGNLPVVMFKTAFLTKTKYKSKKLKEVVKHFDTRDVVVVIPVDDTKQVRDIPSLVKLPMKWVAEVMESHPYPNEVLEFVMRKTQIFPDTDSASTDYIVTWALAVCNATNKTNDKYLSQVGMQLPDIDVINNVFDDWAEVCLTQTVGSRNQSSGVIGGEYRG